MKSLSARALNFRWTSHPVMVTIRVGGSIFGDEFRIPIGLGFGFRVKGLGRCRAWGYGLRV